MNRLSWDTTAPRRPPTQSASPRRPRPEDATLVREVWNQLRSRPF